MRHGYIEKGYLGLVRVVTNATLYGGNGSGRAVNPLLPSLVALLVTLPAKLGRICTGELGTINKTQHLHVSGIVADPTGFVSGPKPVMKLQLLGVTAQAIF